jgi:Peptidase family M23
MNPGRTVRHSIGALIAACACVNLGTAANTNAAAVTSGTQMSPLASTTISQGFAAFGSFKSRKNLCTQSPWPNAKYHVGLDFEAAVGTPVLAVMDGSVAYASPDTGTDNQGDPNSHGYGNIFVVKHTASLYSVYAHLSSTQAARDRIATPGGAVLAGDEIGKSGKSGPPDTPAHLHFEFRSKINEGNAKDPLPAAYGYVCDFGSLEQAGVLDPIDLLFGAGPIDSSEPREVMQTGYLLRKAPSRTWINSQIDPATCGALLRPLKRVASGDASCRGGWLKVASEDFEPGRGCKTDFEDRTFDCFGDTSDKQGVAIELPRYPYAWICADAFEQPSSAIASQDALLREFRGARCRSGNIANGGIGVEITGEDGQFAYFESRRQQRAAEVWDAVFLTVYLDDLALSPGWAERNAKLVRSTISYQVAFNRLDIMPIHGLQGAVDEESD